MPMPPGKFLGAVVGLTILWMIARLPGWAYWVALVGVLFLCSLGEVVLERRERARRGRAAAKRVEERAIKMIEEHVERMGENGCLCLPEKPSPWCEIHGSTMVKVLR